MTFEETVGRRGVDAEAVHTEIASVTCNELPVCVPAIAVYASKPW
jgi:hypothetical protein